MHRGEIIALDAKRRSAQTAWQEMQARRNDLSKQIGQLKSKGQDAAPAMAEVAGLKDKMTAAEAEEQELAKALEFRSGSDPLRVRAESMKLSIVKDAKTVPQASPV